MLNSYDSVFNFETLIIQGAILLACCYGIVRPIFVISVDYGLAILVFGAILVWFLLRAAFEKGLSSTLVALLIQSIVLGAYGLRLAYFIHQRNKRESYMSSRKGSFSKPVSYALTIPLWILVASRIWFKPVYSLYYSFSFQSNSIYVYRSCSSLHRPHR